MQGRLRNRLLLAIVVSAAVTITIVAGTALAVGAGGRAVVAAALTAFVASFGAGWLIASHTAGGLRRSLEAVAVATADERDGGDDASIGVPLEAREPLAAILATGDEQRLRLHAVLDAAELGVVVVDDAAAVRYVNPAAARMLGVEPSACFGRSAIAVLRDHTALDALRETLADGRRRSVTVAVPPDRTCQVSVAPVAGPSGWSAACFVQDVTEVRRLETMRRDFVSNVSHELRTPLASIKAVVETLQAGALDDPEVAQAFLEQVNGEVDRLVQLVEELLELGRIESGLVPFRFMPVSPADLVRDCVRRLAPQAERAGLRLTAEVDDDTPFIQADSERLGRALVNLIHNAIKFTPAGGSVVAQAAGAAGWVELAVRDTGIGIAPADTPRIFERFYKADRSRESAGTGLGLAIVKHIVEAHGGTVAVQSVLGHGSTFTIRLPAQTDDGRAHGTTQHRAPDVPLIAR
jgi:two-component system phosphate regulon sensor histidine kinase PhoR